MKEVRLVFRDPFSRPVPGLLGVGEGELLCRLARRLRRVPPLPPELLEREKLEDLPLEEVRRLAAADPRSRRFLPALLLPRPRGEVFPSPWTPPKGSNASPRLRENWEAARRVHLLKGLRRVLFSGVLLGPGEALWTWARQGGRATRRRSPVEFGLVGWHPSQYRQWAEGAREPNSLDFKEKTRIHPWPPSWLGKRCPSFSCTRLQTGSGPRGSTTPRTGPVSSFPPRAILSPCGPSRPSSYRLRWPFRTPGPGPRRWPCGAPPGWGIPRRGRRLTRSTWRPGPSLADPKRAPKPRGVRAGGVRPRGRGLPTSGRYNRSARQVSPKRGSRGGS